ncbi:MAG: formate/nitrite transporter family protein [Chloroflexota bacterium]|nr:formate/nitrite transporter family protein [Chloroflexota bacterium]
MIVPDRDDVIQQEPKDIADRAQAVGTERLDRGNLEILVTAIIGGGEVSLGAVAAMAVVGSLLKSFPALDLYLALAAGGLVFPIGFLFVIVGRSELFTENFLIPVVSVLQGERTPGSLVLLWAISWIGNLIGCAGTAALLLVPDAIGDAIRLGFERYTTYKLDVPLTGVVASAALAGGVMTAMTWMLLSVKHPVARMLAIYAGGYLLFAANLSHSIVSASALLVGFVQAGASALEVAVWILAATVGNLVGGVGLVTLFRVTQAHEQRKQDS